ncbi:MAG: DsbA family oxidoreductase [Planktotalea sp.]|jgi:predicted DsbA family dithiol-disulfide isomerase|uniref:DsbA family oxidoreductase n=1 Tax=Planktotalea sp. TaxID=2029877 RepID=UPI0001839F6B|nr:DsbA family oxidoreductase [Planktotalea sp.]EDZ42323.1 dsba oxidoreductase [Rhodobacteraceae bacterium HTCC2083]MDG1076419.1 DsbA family oxidoreductase [Planktotalea sp.]MDG1085095.1 DsbA family oxidoreductase [Planktotalea sp.]HCW83619.1 DsbA family oxidoreductase [Paracoccaceae bacterium]
MVKLDIISDPICPWCYIGKTLLDRALEAEPEHPFEIEWHPFQLNPDMPLVGMDRRAYLEGKFGGKEQAVKVYGQIDQHARDVGLELDLGAIKRTPNTLNAHRLIHWAGIEQRQSMVISALFRAYFKEGRDIGDVEVLADLADTCGMDAALVQRLLATDEDLEGIREKDAGFRKMGVNSVPTFIIAGQHAVPGAQSVEVWRNVITDIKSQIEAEE